MISAKIWIGRSAQVGRSWMICRLKLRQQQCIDFFRKIHANTFIEEVFQGGGIRRAQERVKIGARGEDEVKAGMVVI